MRLNLRKFAQDFSGVIRLISFTLLPSYIQRKVRNEPAKPFAESPTSYLNGFRGVMAFLVFVRHFSLPWQPDLDYGFGQGENHTEKFRLPILRMIYAGPNVPIFLIVSGFVMSLKPLKLLNADQKENFFKSMVSSVFRRAIRIFPPPIVSSMLFMLAVHFKLFRFQYYTMNGFIPHHPDCLPTLLEQLEDWLYFVFAELTNPWSWKHPNLVYGAHLWTIGLQFRSSMVLFIVLIGLASTQKQTRQIILTLLFAYCMFSGRWDVALYLSGMFMADIWIGVKSPSSRTVSTALDPERACQSMPATKLRSYSYWSCAIFAGLYLSSYPRAVDGVGAPGYKILYSITPNYRYWQSYGAILLIWCFICSTTAQKPFSYAFPRYLGEISYSLYIVHEPLLHVFGYAMVNLAWQVTGKETNFQYQLGFLLALFLTTPIVLWTADIFHRLVDQPCAEFGRLLETSFK